MQVNVIQQTVLIDRFNHIRTLYAEYISDI